MTTAVVRVRYLGRTKKVITVKMGAKLNAAINCTDRLHRYSQSVIPAGMNKKPGIKLQVRGLGPFGKMYMVTNFSAFTLRMLKKPAGSSFASSCHGRVFKPKPVPEELMA